MLYENKCIKCSDKNCLLCDMINEIEKCSKSEEGYGINEGECKHCSENCINCYFYEGKEQCWSCEKGYYLNKDSKCSSICLGKNCVECSMNQNIELCNKCEEGYKLEKGKCIKCQDINCLRCDDDKNICSECVKLTYLQNGKCFDPYLLYYDCSAFYLDDHCQVCTGEGECVRCSGNYELDDFGDCKQNLVKIIVPIVVSLVVLIAIIVIIVICIRKKRRNNPINEIRINQRNFENNFNSFRNNHNRHNILSWDDIFNKKDSIDEFGRRKIKFENKLCQVCKTEKGKYIGDCGCVVCEKHSNFKSIIKDEEKFLICLNCGKTIKDLKLIKTVCDICL